MKKYDYLNDEYYKEVIEIIGFKAPFLYGSYAKYGKEKSCDMDVNEHLEGFDSELFNNYINKLIKNKDRFYLLEARFSTPDPILKSIRDKMGYLDGLFIKHSRESILNDIETLPNDLRIPMKKLVDSYIQNQTLQNYIKINLFVKNNIYPKWTLKELLKGEKLYYGQLLKMSEMDISVFAIEIIYKNFRVSNFIRFKKTSFINEPYVTNSANAVVYDDGKISYIKLLKKFPAFYRWLIINKYIKDPYLIQNPENISDDINNFIDEFSKKYNKCCLYTNKIDVLRIKINKYENKIKKHNDKNKYQKYINSYQRAIDKLEKEYTRIMDQINDECKPKYETIMTQYSEYLKKYMRYD